MAKSIAFHSVILMYLCTRINLKLTV